MKIDKTIKKIENLRKELRKNYEVIGKLFYEVEKGLDDYLKDLSKRLEKSKL